MTSITLAIDPSTALNSLSRVLHTFMMRESGHRRSRRAELAGHLSLMTLDSKLWESWLSAIVDGYQL